METLRALLTARRDNFPLCLHYSLRAGSRGELPRVWRHLGHDRTWHLANTLRNQGFKTLLSYLNSITIIRGEATGPFTEATIHICGCHSRPKLKCVPYGTETIPANV